MTTASNTPHDALFRALLEDAGLADRLVRDSLPPEVAALLAPAPVRRVSGSWIDEALAGHQTDALFEAGLREGGSTLVYLLLEHKARPDPGVPVQLLRYVTRIWSAHVAENGAAGGLPPVVPVVFYHGRQRWTVPRSVSGMIAAPGPLKALARSMEYILHDLARLAPADLPGDRVARAVLTALVLAFVRDVPRARLVELLAALPEGGALESRVLAYIVSQLNIDEAELRAASREARPLTWETLMGTIAETWIERGKAEGIAIGEQRGKAEGKAETLLRQLRRRFGALPGPVEARVGTASPAQVDGWLDAVLDGDSLGDVLAAPPRKAP